MDKLTRYEASRILLEARRLEALYKESKARFGQAIWWCYTDESALPEDIKGKLYDLLDADRATDNDFYHWIDDHKIIQKFYELYVEQS